MKTIKLIIMLAFVASIATLMSCGEDEGPSALTIVSIEASGTDVLTGEPTTIDLNGATAASGVPVDLVLTITFERPVDEATANNTSVTIDGVTADVTVNEAVVTLSPSQELARGTDYVLTIGDVEASDGGQFAGTSRTFSTGGVAEVTPPNADAQVTYWKFDGNANDQVGSHNPTAEIAIDYQIDRHGQAASTAYFDGDASIIEYANGSSIINSDNFTVSFWIKTDTEGHVDANDNLTGMFVFGLGAHLGIQYEIFDAYDGSKFAVSYENANGDTFGEDMWFPSEATDNTSGGWQGWTYANSLTVEQMQAKLKDNWLHVIYTFDGSERVGSLYFDGVLMKSFDFDLWPEGDAKLTTTGLKYRGAEPDVVDELALGFIQSRAGTMWDAEPWGGYEITTSKHFKGWMDDFRVFHAAFTADDATTLHNAEKP